MQILFANEGLAPELAELFDAYRQFFTGYPDLERSRTFVNERLRASDSIFFVAVEAGHVIGFTQLYPIWSSWYCKRIWFLSDLYVAESARKAGTGSALIERVKAYARETGASSVMVELPKSEPSLHRFYAGLGFTVDEIFDLARFRQLG